MVASVAVVVAAMAPHIYLAGGLHKVDAAQR